MRLESLKYFMVTADSGSMTRASKILHVSQQCISREIMALENELNIKLFSRSNKGVYLTEEGIEAYEYSKRILKQISEFRSRFNQSDELNKKIYSVGCYWALREPVIKALNIFCALHPNIFFNEYIIGSSNLEKNLVRETIESDSFDLLITQVDESKFETIIEKTKYKYIIINKEQLKVLAWTSLSEFDLNELANYPIAFYSDNLDDKPLYYEIAMHYGWKKIVYKGNNIDKLFINSYKEKAILLLTESVQIPFSDKVYLVPAKQSIEIYTILFYKSDMEELIDLNTLIQSIM